MSEREKAWTCLTSVRTTEFFRFYDQNKPHKKIASSNWTGLRLLLFLLLLHWKDQCHYAPIATAAAAAAVKLFINIIQVDRIFMCVCVRVLHLFSLSLIHSARLVSLSLFLPLMYCFYFACLILCRLRFNCFPHRHTHRGNANSFSILFAIGRYICMNILMYCTLEEGQQLQQWQQNKLLYTHAHIPMKIKLK